MRHPNLAKSPRHRRGMSLVELMVVAAIILVALSMILAVVAKAWRAVENLKK